VKLTLRQRVQSLLRRPHDIHIVHTDRVEIAVEAEFQVVVDNESGAALESVEEYSLRSYSHGVEIMTPCWLLRRWGREVLICSANPR